MLLEVQSEVAVNKTNNTEESGRQFAVEKFNVREEMKSRLGMTDGVKENKQDSAIQKWNSNPIRIPTNPNSQEYLTREHNKVKTKISDIELL